MEVCLGLLFGAHQADNIPHEAQRVTNETYRWVSDARFHPSGSKVVATKWYTSERSLGAGEGWEYPVASLEDLQAGINQTQVEVGNGSRVLGRTLPPGWSVEDYGDQQIGPEQFIWNGPDSIIYSKNVRDASVFSYSKGVFNTTHLLLPSLIFCRCSQRNLRDFPAKFDDEGHRNLS